MNRIVNILLFFVLFVSTDIYAVDNYLNTKKSLDFDNNKYTLGWSSHPSDFQYLQEYFPKGQSPEKFKDMLSVWLLVGDFSAEQFIQNMANNYEERKKIDKVSNYQTYEKDGEYMFDCLRSEGDGGYVTGVEFNIYRCKEVEIDDRKALLICFYSGQATGDDIMPFLKDLKERRLQLIEAMVKFEYPEIKLN